MFGYITAYQDAMSEEDKETYQSYYCGLCSELGRKFGRKSQLILTYDLVFLAILNNALYEEEEHRKTSLCLWKGCRVSKTDTSSLSYAADMNLLLAYHNFRDQVIDSNNAKAKAAVKLLKKEYEKVSLKYPRQKKAVETYMEELLAWEKNPADNPDFAANLTGKMLSEVFLEKEDVWAPYLKQMFWCIGKYIYLIDAYEDVFDDLNKQSYNPYSVFSTRPDFDDFVQKHLEQVMAGCGKALEALPIFRHKEILRNIIYSGVWLSFGRTKKQRSDARKENEKVAGD